MQKIIPNIHSSESVNDLIEYTAKRIIHSIHKNIEQQGICRLALAGGNTPRPIYERLAQADYIKGIDWSRVHFFWGDERCVAADDPKSNYNMAHKAWLSHLPLANDSNIHRIPAELGGPEAAWRYAEILGNEPLHLILLGMGNDGHIASLFPDSKNINGDKTVIATQSPIAPAERVSLSLKPINQASEIYLIVAGNDKSQRLAQVLLQIEQQQQQLPAARLQPEAGQLFWLCDSDALQHISSQRMEKQNG